MVANDRQSPDGTRGLWPWVIAIALAAVTARLLWIAFGALDIFADYHAYYRAAANLRAGADLYAEGKLLVARNSYDFWTQTDGQYVYPPALALALLPLTTISIGQGGTVWLLVLLLAVLAAVWLAGRVCGRAVGWRSCAALALPLAGALPLLLGIRYGIVGREATVLAALALGPALALGLVTRRRSLAADAVALALVAIGVLALALGLRDREIDPFLLALSGPGIVGALTLAWWGQAATVRACRRDWPALAPLAIPLVGGTPLLLGVQYGQVDLVLLLLTTGAFLAGRARRDILAGVALGLAAAVKPTLALYGLYYLRKRAWATLGTAAIVGTLAGVAPFLILDGGALRDWFTIARYFGAGDYLSYPTNGSLRGVLLRAFVGGPGRAPLLVSPPLATGLWAIVAGATALAWWRRVGPGRGTAAAAREWSLTVALILFAAPLSEDIHFVALLLPLAFLADRAARGVATARWRVLAIAACAVFIPPLVDLGERVASGAPARLGVTAIYLGGLVLVGLALATLPREREHERRPLANAAPTAARSAWSERANLGDRPT